MPRFRLFWRTPFRMRPHLLQPKRSYGSHHGKVALYAALFVLVPAASVMYYFWMRALEAKKVGLRQSAGVRYYGKAALGGPFSLVRTDGRPITYAELRGKFVMIYFGFTNCPDVCPDELAKMSRLIALLDKDPDVGPSKVVPLFITIDPDRDSLGRISEYLKDFNPRIVGLGGEPSLIELACRMWRVYFSVPDLSHFDAQDYLIDHSIATYLMAPNGEYLSHVTKTVPGHIAFERFRSDIVKWKPPAPEVLAAQERAGQSVQVTMGPGGRISPAELSATGNLSDQHEAWEQQSRESIFQGPTATLPPSRYGEDHIRTT
eukprot:TRINITY_DN39134_c0_g1_i1.p1 TRINITY_DN39134_c0_g1~~TRINITY_DN39134_c0_g1_i1.p1  ORF type:complete len:318 (-),score=39.43 TRINITY_DN39134_c0_g1_i1:181-1134(-)